VADNAPTGAAALIVSEIDLNRFASGGSFVISISTLRRQGSQKTSQRTFSEGLFAHVVSLAAD
jgi:hypothetical protein